MKPPQSYLGTNEFTGVTYKSMGEVLLTKAKMNQR